MSDDDGMSGGDVALTIILLFFILFYCCAPIIHYCIRCNDCCRKNNVKKYMQSRASSSKSKPPTEISTIERDGHKTQEQIDESFKNDFSFWRYTSMYFHLGLVGLVIFIIAANMSSYSTTRNGLSILCYLCLSVTVLYILYEIMISYECKYLSNLKQEKPLLEYLKGKFLKKFIFIFE